jgi:succinate-semialdehyde dehydrogenase / glutarate-semialdehyde dehydrogenase
MTHDAFELRDRALLHHQALIDGVWTDAANQATDQNFNPATGAFLGTAPAMGAQETRAAIAAAVRAQPAWAARPARERSAILRRWHDLCLEHQEDLARLLTIEQGKPIREARAEVTYGARFIEWFAEEAKRAYGDLMPSESTDTRIVVMRQPIGVTAAITAWNFPIALLTRKVAPALAAGCTQVVKPAPQTPFITFALADLAIRAGVPAGVLNVVTGDAVAIGAEMTANRDVRLVTFTGSTDVGRTLLRQSANTVKKVDLELGGNAPFIVFEDADLEHAIGAVMDSKFRNTGQTCICANRIYVQASVYDEFARQLVQRVAALKVGNGLDESTTQGPLIDTRAVAKVERHIADAVAHGAQVLIGGQRLALGPNYFAPTVLANATRAMALANEETFGPVAPLFRFRDEREVCALANDTEAGLAGYVCTADLSRAWRVAEALQFGVVGVNTGVVSTAVAPFGGMKQSGLGREGSRFGLEEYLEKKYVCFGRLGP